VRVLKNEILNYATAHDDEEGGGVEETGWKLVHGDVFRFPEHKAISRLVGPDSALHRRLHVPLSPGRAKYGA